MSGRAPVRAAALGLVLVLVGATAVASAGTGVGGGGTLYGEGAAPIGCTSRPGTIVSEGPHIPVVALTFDDGPSTTQTPAILTILDSMDARATFFEEGRHVAGREELTRQILAAGDAPPPASRPASSARPTGWSTPRSKRRRSTSGCRRSSASASSRSPNCSAAGCSTPGPRGRLP